MDILLETLGPGVHCYSPFSKSVCENSPLNLTEICKNVILKSVTLRRLSTAVNTLPLPKRLLRYITDLTTADFEKIECAPFSDAFSFNFLHRALTYRVVCLLDGLEYMITYGYSPVEKLKLKTDHKQWVKIQHENVMCICATVRDPSTDNIFYVYDQPRISLDQMWTVFCTRNQSLPDTFFWRVTSDLCEALKFILKNGLQYSHFWLDNIFIVDDRLVLENGLMRKGVKYTVINAKGEYIDEENALCDIIYILKHLIQNHDHSDSLQKLITQVENGNSLDVVLDLVNDSVQNLNSFSFLKLIRSLKE